jgi:uncharacterized protein YgiM (DUF1202 family)
MSPRKNEERMNKPKSKRRWLIVASLLSIAVAASAETVYVKLPVANVLAGKGAGTDHIAQLKKGDKLEVQGQEGSWLKVKVEGKEGYVHQNSVSTSSVAKDDSLSKKLQGGSGSQEANAGLASSGIGESLQYAHSKGLSTVGLDRMLALRKTVKGSEWTAFTAEGHVGPDKK